MVRQIIILKKKNLIEELKKLGLVVIFRNKDTIVLRSDSSDLSRRQIRSLLDSWEIKIIETKNNDLDKDLKEIMRQLRGE